MRTASLRQVQHNFGEVLRWLADGDEVQITRRRKVVAKLVPANPARAAKVDWTAHERDLNRAFPNGPLRGSPATDMVLEQRAERG